MEPTPAEEQVLAIVTAAPQRIAGAVNAYYVAYGDHGLRGPSNIASASAQLRRLERQGALVRVGRNPPTYRRAIEEQR